MQAIMPRNATQVILNEHGQLSAVIGGMLRFVERVEGGEQVPGIMVLRAMLYYIREYPEQVHHPKEDCYLFPPLSGRSSELDAVIGKLRSQHAEDERLVRALEDALTRYELKGEPAFAELRDLVRAFAEFYFEHMRLEEEVVLPAARRLLTNAEWERIDTGFGTNRDPFEGTELEDDLERLFEMIVKILP
ncbi:hemerythrin [Trinickia symbiotica]|uniref:Hemerythrin n=1 Tax=Trinickia symbiotica TaxID=863227 RepID=A0A2T3XR85_9BURK|nr:hemerythrin domain-containing protein [Trinickia symbiotica]PTB19024.1 hemerythrin [Trinickia symbiotica]